MNPFLNSYIDLNLKVNYSEILMIYNSPGGGKNKHLTKAITLGLLAGLEQRSDAGVIRLSLQLPGCRTSCKTLNPCESQFPYL